MRVRQKSFAILAGVLLALAGALAATRHLTLRQPVEESSSSEQTAKERSPTRAVGLAKHDARSMLPAQMDHSGGKDHG